MAGRLLDRSNHWIDFQNAEYGQRLPAGKGVIHLDFPGAKIAALDSDGPLVVSELTLACNDPLKPQVREAAIRRADSTTANPISNFWSAALPPGLAILTAEPTDCWPAFLRVREEIVKHATLP